MTLVSMPMAFIDLLYWIAGKIDSYDLLRII